MVLAVTQTLSGIDREYFLGTPIVDSFKATVKAILVRISLDQIVITSVKNTGTTSSSSSSSVVFADRLRMRGLSGDDKTAVKIRSESESSNRGSLVTSKDGGGRLLAAATTGVSVEYTITYIAEEISQSLGGNGNITKVSALGVLTAASNGNSSASFSAILKSTALASPTCGPSTVCGSKVEALQVKSTTGNVVSSQTFTAISYAPTPSPTVAPTPGTPTQQPTTTPASTVAGAAAAVLIFVICSSFAAYRCQQYSAKMRTKRLKDKEDIRTGNTSGFMKSRQEVFLAIDELYDGEEKEGWSDNPGPITRTGPAGGRDRGNLFALSPGGRSRRERSGVGSSQTPPLLSHFRRPSPASRDLYSPTTSQPISSDEDWSLAEPADITGNRTLPRSPYEFPVKSYPITAFRTAYGGASPNPNPNPGLTLPPRAPVAKLNSAGGTNAYTFGAHAKTSEAKSEKPPKAGSSANPYPNPNPKALYLVSSDVLLHRLGDGSEIRREKEAEQAARSAAAEKEVQRAVRREARRRERSLRVQEAQRRADTTLSLYPSPGLAPTPVITGASISRSDDDSSRQSRHPHPSQALSAIHNAHTNTPPHEVHFEHSVHRGSMSASQGGSFSGKSPLPPRDRVSGLGGGLSSASSTSSSNRRLSSTHPIKMASPASAPLWALSRADIAHIQAREAGPPPPPKQSAQKIAEDARIKRLHTASTPSLPTRNLLAHRRYVISC